MVLFWGAILKAIMSAAKGAGTAAKTAAGAAKGAATAAKGSAVGKVAGKALEAATNPLSTAGKYAGEALGGDAGAVLGEKIGGHISELSAMAGSGGGGAQAESVPSQSTEPAGLLADPAAVVASSLIGGLPTGSSVRPGEVPFAVKIDPDSMPSEQEGPLSEMAPRFDLERSRRSEEAVTLEELKRRRLASRLGGF